MIEARTHTFQGPFIFTKSQMTVFVLDWPNQPPLAMTIGPATSKAVGRRVRLMRLDCLKCKVCD